MKELVEYEIVQRGSRTEELLETGELLEDYDVNEK